MHVLDPPGFQNPASTGKTEGALFEDLCHNYVYERLQKFFHSTVFTTQMERYSQVRALLTQVTLVLIQTAHNPPIFRRIVEIENLSLRAAILNECQIYLGGGDRFGIFLASLPRPLLTPTPTPSVLFFTYETRMASRTGISARF